MVRIVLAQSPAHYDFVTVSCADALLFVGALASRRAFPINTDAAKLTQTNNNPSKNTESKDELNAC